MSENNQVAEETAQETTESAEVQVDAAQELYGKTDAEVRGENTKQAKDDAVEEQKKEPDEVAPDKYEFVPPEGMTFDAEFIERYSVVAKDLNLPQAKAQELLVKMTKTVADRQQSRLVEATAEWGRASAADAEFGGDKFNSNLKTASGLVDRFGTKEFKALLRDTGLGNHPEVIRFMVRAGTAMKEESFVGGAAQKTKSAPMDFNARAAALYSN